MATKIARGLGLDVRSAFPLADYNDDEGAINAPAGKSSTTNAQHPV
jgi:hypothetical protein